MKTLLIFKKFVILLFLFIINHQLNAQTFKKIDKAGHDIAYYRESRAITPKVKVIYGRPKKDDQPVFGNLVAYNTLWRTGANEATEVKFYEKTVFGGVIIKAGTYVLYTIPGEKEWEIILNTNLDVLGAFQYDPVYDIARIKIKPSKAEELEAFSIGFKERKQQIEMVLAWDTTRVKIPIKFIKREEFAKI